MNEFSVLVEQVLTRLQQAQGLNGIDCLEAYPGVVKVSPLVRPAVTAEMSGAEIYSNAYGDGQAEGTFAKYALVTVTLTFFVPLLQGGTACRDYFTSACSALLFQEAMTIKRITSQKTKYDDALKAFTLECQIELETLLGQI